MRRWSWWSECSRGRQSQRLRDSATELWTSVSRPRMQKPGQVLSPARMDGQPRAPWVLSFSKECGFRRQWPRENLRWDALKMKCVHLISWDFLDDSSFPLSGRWKCFRKKSSLVINSLSPFLTSQARLMGWAGWHRSNWEYHYLPCIYLHLC